MKKVTLVNWLVLSLLCTYLVTGNVFDWEEWKRDLNELKCDYSMTKKAGDDFERGLDEDAFPKAEEQLWNVIIPSGSDFMTKEKTKRRFKLDATICKELLEYRLTFTTQFITLPSALCQTLCTLLRLEEDDGQHEDNNRITIEGKDEKIIQIVKTIPTLWIKKYGRLFMDTLTRTNPSKLVYLNRVALTALLNNSDNACCLITLDVLLNLNRKDLKLLSPNCIRSIEGLKIMDLSSIVGSFRKDAFAEYNDPLSKETIKELTIDQVKNYGSLSRDGEICSHLQLNYLSVVAAGGISSDCLYGYFNSGRDHQEEEMMIIGLGKLWNSIQVDQLNDIMNASRGPFWEKVPLEDFNSMDDGLLKIILYNFKVCPTVEIPFWGEKEKIQYISPECLYKIFIETGPSIKLGELWKYIPWLVMHQFTDEMKLSWVKIQLQDYDSMSPNLLSLVTSSPKVCNSLGRLFWVKERRIKYIPAECLYFILKKAKRPVRLGSLWKDIPFKVISRFNNQMKSSWLKIHHDDFDLMSFDTLESILSFPKMCTILGISFWRKSKIKCIPAQCLYQIIIDKEEPVQLGQLWGQISKLTLDRFTKEMRPSWLKIANSDFALMSLDALEILSSESGICSKLATSFWTEQRISHISGQCLYELLTKYGAPVKLGVHWKNIKTYSIYTLMKKTTKFTWSLIHPSDRNLARDAIGIAIEDQPLICTVLEIDFWTSETIEYVTADCLYQILLKAKRSFSLKDLWAKLSPLTIREFKGVKLFSIKNVSGGDFQYMPLELLKSIFYSERVVEYLPEASVEIILSPQTSNSLKLDSQQFVTITRFASSVAGQLLWYSMSLPLDILSKCNGDDIQSLNFTTPGKMRLDWKTLFTRLQEKYSSNGRVEIFNQMIQLISTKSDGQHFCSTIYNFDVYLSLSWLSRNLSNSCYSSIPFKQRYISQVLRAPELAPKNLLPWRSMLRAYNHQDWAEFSTRPRAVALLGTHCEFWIEVGGDWVKLLGALYKSMLENITPDCVLKMEKILIKNIKVVSLLASDAFSKHKVNQLPCRLKDLSPAQIAQLSKQTVKDGESRPSEKEISHHALSRITANDLKALNLAQFKSIYENQWSFIPKEIKDGGILSHRLQLAQSQIVATLAQISEAKYAFDGRVTQATSAYLKVIQGELELVRLISKDYHQRILNFVLFSIFPTTVNLRMNEKFMEIFKGPSLGSLFGIFSVSNAEELRNFNLEEIKKMGDNQENLMVSHDARFGFDRFSTLQLLYNSPELFAAPGARVFSHGIIDCGGAIRALTNQLLNDIWRDLVVPYTERSYSGLTPTNNNIVEIDSGVNIMVQFDDVLEGGGGNAKFGWGISGENGLIVGLVLGKALQLDIRLPFALDLEFYKLLVDTSEKAIDEYYRKAYFKEILKFKQGIVDLFNTGDLQEPLQILTKPETLRFTKLSTKVVEGEQGNFDLFTRTNLWGCHNNRDCYNDVKELNGQNFMKEYIKTVLEKSQSEFKRFTRKLVKGLGMALPPVKEFKDLPLSILNPFVKFLPEILNAKPIKSETVLSRVKFNQDYMVQSLIQGQTIEASKVFSAFILSLGGRQLENLIGIWTGSSTLSLEYFNFSIIFILPGNIEAYKVNFCDPIKAKTFKDNDRFIGPGKEYQTFFKKFTQKLLGPDVVEVNLDCNSSEKSVAIIPIRISTCAKSLMIYLQTAEQIFNSLVDLLYTSVKTLGDY